jgi:hypothetical protein
MPYTLSFPAAEPDFWQLHLDLLAAACAQLTTICREMSGPGRAYAESLQRADRQTIVEIEMILHVGPAAPRQPLSMGSVR